MSALLPLISALAPMMPELIKQVPNIMSALQGKSTLSKQHMQIIKNKVKETKKLSGKERSRALRILGITKNSLEPDLASGSNQVLDDVPGESKVNILKGADNAISNNSLMRLGMKVGALGSAPFLDQVTDGVCVSGVERIGTITARGNGESTKSRVGNQVSLHILNPRLFTGTRLAVYSTLYQRYFFRKIELQYVPTVSTLEPGQLVMGVLENTGRNVPFGEGESALTALMEIKNTIAFPVGYPQTMTYKFENRPQPLWLSATYLSGVVNTLINQASIFLADGSNLEANKTYGQLYLKYDICMYDGWVDRGEIGQKNVKVYAGTYSAGAPYIAALNIPPTDPAALTDFQNNIPASSAVTYYALYFEEDDESLRSASWPTTYKAGQIMYAAMTATSPPIWSAGTSLSIALYPTETDLHSETNKVYRLSSTGNIAHQATFIPLVSAFALASGIWAEREKFHLEAAAVGKIVQAIGESSYSPPETPLESQKNVLRKENSVSGTTPDWAFNLKR